MSYYLDQERKRKEASEKEKERLYYLELSGRIIERRRQIEAAERERSGVSSSYSHPATSKDDDGIIDKLIPFIMAIMAASALASILLGMFLSGWTDLSLLPGSGLIWFIVSAAVGATYYSRKRGWISAEVNLYPLLAVVVTIAILVNIGWWLGAAYP